jgi:hypothetical protein
MEANMRRGFAIAALIAAAIGGTAVPAAAQGWGYDYYGGPGIGVSVGFGGPAFGAYAADYGSYAAVPGYAYSAAPCSCSTAYGYGGPGYAGYYRPGYASAGLSYAYEPGYAYSYSYSSRPGYGYEATYAYGNRSGYAWRGSRVSTRGEIRQGVRARPGVRSAAFTRERTNARTAIRSETVGIGASGRGVRGSEGVRANRASTMRSRQSNAQGNFASSPQGGAELRGGTVGRGGGSTNRMNGQGERR